MMPEKINYGLRPCKCIERKMLVEAFRCLGSWGRISSYRYVGFGSHFFNDFILVHKALGIRDMVSVEREKIKKERFDFNRPFKCVKMEYGESTDILPQLTWNVRTICWLDYPWRL